VVTTSSNTSIPRVPSPSQSGRHVEVGLRVEHQGGDVDDDQGGSRQAGGLVDRGQAVLGQPCEPLPGPGHDAQAQADREQDQGDQAGAAAEGPQGDVELGTGHEPLVVAWVAPEPEVTVLAVDDGFERVVEVVARVVLEVAPSVAPEVAPVLVLGPVVVPVVVPGAEPVLVVVVVVACVARPR
jgi:hypothetical protein